MKKKIKKSSVGIVDIQSRNISKDKKEEKGYSYKAIETKYNNSTVVDAFQYVNTPISFESLFSLYKEDETIGSFVDKTSDIAASERIIITSRTNNKSNIEKANNIINGCYLFVSNVGGYTVKKKMSTKEFFKFLFSDYMIYRNAYFEISRSIDKSTVAFIYKDPRKIRVLKNHLGYVELGDEYDDFQKYFYNNYEPDASQRANFLLHYAEGLMKPDKAKSTPSIYKRELVHIRGYGDMYYGLSALYSIGTSSLLQIQSKDLPVRLMKNGMINTPVITFSGAEVPPEVKKEIEDKFKYKVVGKDKAGTPIILYSSAPGSKIEVNGAPVHNFSLEDVRKMYKLGESNVIKRFGIPPEKLSILENSNRATIEEADQIMTEEIVDPIQSLFEFQINTIFNSDLKLDVEMKFSDRIYNWSKLATVTAVVKGMSTNEIRELILELPKVDDENADVVMVKQSDSTIENVVNRQNTGQIPIQFDTKKDIRKIEALKDSLIALLKMRNEWTQKN